MFQSPELNLSEEFNSLLLTDTDCTPIYSPYIWRKFERSGNRRKNCQACNKEDGNYIEGAHECPYCRGYGYIFKDEIIKGYLAHASVRRSFSNLSMEEEAGLSDKARYLLFTDKSVRVLEEDFILIPQLDENGRISIPLYIEQEKRCLYSDRYTANGAYLDFNLALLGGK